MKPTGVTRRRFIWGLPIFALTLIAGHFFGTRWGQSKPSDRQAAQSAFEQELIRIIRSKLPYLKVGDGEISSFAKDLQKYEPSFSSASVQALKNSETTLCEKFILSTDFFWSGSDPTQDAHYRAYHDPYISKCTNPFFYQGAQNSSTFAGSS